MRNPISKQKRRLLPKRQNIKELKCVVILISLFLSWMETSDAMITSVPIKQKREANVKRNLVSKTDERNLSGKNITFGHLVALAQEEAKCLEQFGTVYQTPASDFPNDEVYRPFICSSSSFSTKCEMCQNLTARVRTKEECSTYCMTQTFQDCANLCSEINSAVFNTAQKINDSSNFSKEETTTTSKSLQHKIINGKVSKSQSVFSHIPQVFCEGVHNRSEDLANPTSSRAVITFSGNLTPSDSKAKTPDHFVVLKWNIRKSALNVESEIKESNSFRENKKLGPILFVIEKYSKAARKWEALGKTPNNLQMINVSYTTATFAWRVTAVGTNGILDQVTSQHYKTLDGYKKPGAPKKIYILKTAAVPHNITMVHTLIGWDPPEENTCFYKIVVGSHEGPDTFVRIKHPNGEHHYWFALLAGKEYFVWITARDAGWKQSSESSLTRLDFKTPTCLESHEYRFEQCAPPPPTDVAVKVQPNAKDGKVVGILLSWKAPENTSKSNEILYYDVNVRKSHNNRGKGRTASLPESSIKNLNISPDLFNSFRHHKFNSSNVTRVSGNTTFMHITWLEVNKEHEVAISAISKGGTSKPAQLLFVTKISQNDDQSFQWLFLTLSLLIVFLILIMCAIIRIYLRNRDNTFQRDQYYQNMEERNTLERSIAPLTEEASTWKLFGENFLQKQWKISYEHLMMGEIIGEGAFGVVRKAKIHKFKLHPNIVKYLDKQNELLENDPHLKTVAVKMLKVSATKEDKEQLVAEIMTMQGLDFHPQIVTLIGACTIGKSLSLVLEHCPGGNLLTFIRKVREKHWPTFGFAAAKDVDLLSKAPSSYNTNTDKGLKLCGPCNENHPLNYADLEHFIDESSSSKSTFEQGNPLNQLRNRTQVAPPEEHYYLQSIKVEKEEHCRPIDEKDVLSYARQIAMGMEYLERNRIVHRDLACRNCLLMGDYKQLKLSDFGLSRDIYTGNVYHQEHSAKLPIKWMAIESIFSQVYTTKSDVWSYGIVLWELITLGATPYPGLESTTELFHLLKTGYRMDRPDNSSEKLYALMKTCWRTCPSDRPSFAELKNYVQEMMEAALPNLYISLVPDLPTDFNR